MRICLVLLLCVVVASCSRISLSDWATASGATVGAGVGAATGIHPLVTLSTAAGGAVAGAALVAETETVADVCAGVPTDQYQSCVTKYKIFELFNTLWKWAVGGTVILITIAWLIPGPTTWFRRKENAEASPPRKSTRSSWPDS